MKKRLLTVITVALMLPFASSCGSKSSFSGSISFYDGTSLLGTISGASGTIIKDSDSLKAKLAGYEVKTGYEFDSWHEKSDFTDSKVYVNAIPYSEVNLYGKFLKEVTITLSAGDGAFAEGAVTTYSGIQSKEVAETFPKPTKSKAYFAGYAIQGTTDILDEKYFYPAEDETLVAQYTDWPTLTVDFNLDGVENITGKFEPGTKIPSTFVDASTLSTSTRRFDGFFSKEDLSGAVFDFSSMPYNSTTIYAKYSYKHTIKFTTYVEGYTLDNLVGYSGDDIQAPTPDKDDFVKAGYYFDGWYEDDAFATRFVFATMPNADKTLYAKWTVDPSLEISYHLSDTDATQSCYTGSFAPGTSLDLTALKPISEIYALTSNKYALNGYYILSGTERKYISTPSAYVLNKNVTVYVDLVFLNGFTIDFADAYGNDITDPANVSLKAASASNNVTQSELDASLASSFDSSVYKIEAYSSSYKNSDSESYIVPLSFPYHIDDGSAIYAILVKKTAFTVSYVDLSGTSHDSGATSGYQKEALDKPLVSIVGDYYAVNGTTTAIAVKDNTYYATINEGGSVKRLASLPSVNPQADQTITIHFQVRGETV